MHSQDEGEGYRRKHGGTRFMSAQRPRSAAGRDGRAPCARPFEEMWGGAKTARCVPGRPVSCIALLATMLIPERWELIARVCLTIEIGLDGLGLPENDGARHIGCCEWDSNDLRSDGKN